MPEKPIVAFTKAGWLIFGIYHPTTMPGKICIVEAKLTK
jgi:hypothetical protein